MDAALLILAFDDAHVLLKPSYKRRVAGYYYSRVILTYLGYL